jgi:hypothetical protein
MARTSRFCTGLFSGMVTLGLGAGTALAQERPAAGGPPGGAPARETDANSSEYVLKTQFVESVKAKKWKDAVETFGKLRQAHPTVLTDKRLQFMHAQALYESKAGSPEIDPDRKGATTALEGILKQQDNHIEALYLLAKIRAASNAPGDKDKAKDHLIASARAGQFVLRDISADKTFEFLLKEPGFILRVLNASNEYQVAAGGQHNFFVSPLIPKEAGGDDEPTGPIIPGATGDELKMKDLEERIEGLFREIVKLAEERQVEELITKFTELRQVMNEFGSSGTAEVRKKLDKWNQRLSDLGEVQLSIKLQVYITEGNQHLKAMADAIRDDLFDVALDRFNQINDLCEQMRSEEREVFKRNAEALFLRGKALADRARRLKRISEFTLKIEGVIVAPPDGKEADSAIINDRIYHEGDTIYDKDSEEEIPGLRVVEIVRSTVRFRYEDTEFVRELQPQK